MTWNLKIKSRKGMSPWIMNGIFHFVEKSSNLQTRKRFNVVSTLLLGWYDVATSQNVKLTLKQRCERQRLNLERWTPSNQRCFNFVFQLWFEQSYHFQRRLSFSFEQRCHFQRRFSQHWAMLKQRCEYDHLKKNKNYASSQKQNNSFELQRIGWTQNLLHFILHFKRNM